MTSPAGLLRDARTQASITQAELARKLGVKQPMIARLEREGANPRFETLERAIAATGYSLTLALRPPPSIDVTMIQADRKLSPSERFRRFEGMYAFARQVGGAAARGNGP